MITFAVCDDEPLMARELAGRITDYMSKASKRDCSVSSFSNGRVLLERAGSFDVIFLDVQMEQPDGMETARLLRRRGDHALLVFVTVLKECVFDSFQVEAFDYLLKPLDGARFDQTMDRLLRSLEPAAFGGADSFFRSVHRLLPHRWKAPGLDGGQPDAQHGAAAVPHPVFLRRGAVHSPERLQLFRPRRLSGGGRPARHAAAFAGFGTGGAAVHPVRLPPPLPGVPGSGGAAIADPGGPCAEGLHDRGPGPLRADKILPPRRQKPFIPPGRPAPEGKAGGGAGVPEKAGGRLGGPVLPLPDRQPGGGYFAGRKAGAGEGDRGGGVPGPAQSLRDRRP